PCVSAQAWEGLVELGSCGAGCGIARWMNGCRSAGARWLRPELRSICGVHVRFGEGPARLCCGNLKLEPSHMTTALHEIEERTNLTGNNKFELMLFRLGEAPGTERRELFGINVFK